MSFSNTQRTNSWNVEFFNSKSFIRIAGVFQLADMLSIADITHELYLCLVFDEPNDDAASYEPALLLRGTPPKSLIFLDRQDNSPFPTPTPAGGRDSYDFLFHSSRCARRGDLHTLSDTCIYHTDMPQRRVDPRYLDISVRSTDERLGNFPTRPSSLKRESSSSRTPSLSPSRPDFTGADDPSIIFPNDASRLMRLWPSNVFQHCTQGCVITGKGRAGGVQGPGLEAAHIVPQSQWNTFPIDNSNSIADPGLSDQLLQAWRSTWSAELNGIMLLSHLYKCFNARLVAIHPKTHLIRAFVDYDVITEFYGMRANLPRLIPEQVLQHHWDMCCLENTPGPAVPSPSRLTNIPELPRPKARKLDYRDPSKEDPNTQASNTQAPDTQAPDTQYLQTYMYQSNKHPPSPPLSERASEERTLWHFGKGIIKDTETVQQLVGEDQVLEVINDAEYGRGRPRVRQRCTSADNGDACGKQGVKRQRLELSPDIPFTDS
ncbi:hypothetical protein VM1G_02328 [Cytospora mali]|uniref:HNH nuclease domain-containing protein n=1 Tax=Cytospora mali TaxID=578113 RepID=A0A194VRF5_CYTMA|nr:hypothetical protein VM1G_02328 [Valsa mali]